MAGIGKYKGAGKFTMKMKAYGEGKSPLEFDLKNKGKFNFNKKNDYSKTNDYSGPKTVPLSDHEKKMGVEKTGGSTSENNADAADRIEFLEQDKDNATVIGKGKLTTQQNKLRGSIKRKRN